MHGPFWLSLVMSLAVALQGRAADLSEHAEETSADEQALRAAGLTTDGPALLDFFRARAKFDLDGITRVFQVGNGDNVTDDDVVRAAKAMFEGALSATSC